MLPSLPSYHTRSLGVILGFPQPLCPTSNHSARSVSLSLPCFTSSKVVKFDYTTHVFLQGWRLWDAHVSSLSFREREGGSSMAKDKGWINKKTKLMGCWAEAGCARAFAQTLVNSTVTQGISGSEMTSLTTEALLQPALPALILSCLDQIFTLTCILLPLKFILYFVPRLTL